ncbi:MAG: DUF4391 domain-containing protein [Synergistaceae bacterium]|nr:DUF4391 domain-containing protein [Synergistaceae bacterium]
MLYGGNMIKFPEATQIHKRLPKEAFYKRLDISTALKDKFISDVDRIFIENSLTMENLNLSQESEVKEILLLSISLKKKEFDGKIIEAIARQNSHELIFLLSFEEERQLAVFHGKLYRSRWMPENEISLYAQGFSLEEIRDGFIEQIALTEERPEAVTDSMTIDQRLGLQEKIVKLEKLVNKTESAVWKEIQPNKRFSLYQKLQKYKKELEDLKFGKS